MLKRLIITGTLAALIVAISGCAGAANQTQWAIHDMNRPLPKVVTPGEQTAKAPSDAIILFDGNDLSQWLDSKGNAAQWKAANGYMEVTGTGNIETKKSFGSCQLHIEWFCPEEKGKEGQESGNSGVFLMSKYELQVLNSYGNKTYADGSAGAIYGQYPPLVNACRKPGEWQSYDIIFHRPIFAKDGKVTRAATMTVLQNGVLIQDNAELSGPTVHKARPKYEQHPDKLPLVLQDHGSLVRFRNIWIRELP